jgi:hypothetical protein
LFWSQYATAALKISFPNDAPAEVLDYFGGRRVFLEGDIEPGDAERVRKAFAANHFETGSVFVNSKGGSVVEAIEIGRFIRKEYLNTFLGGSDRWSKPICLSACAFIYMGGKFRSYNKDGVFGVHRFRSTIKDEKGIDHAQMIDSLIVAYLSEMGIRPEFMSQSARAASDEMNILSEETLKKLDIVNNGSLPPSWTLATHDGVIYLRGAQEKWTGPGKVTLNCLPKGELIFVGFFGPITNSDEILKSTGAQAILIDGQELSLGTKRIIDNNGTLFGIYQLSESLAAKVKAAKSSLGWAFSSTSMPGTFRGIRVDLDDEGLKVFRSFLKSCEKL